MCIHPEIYLSCNKLLSSFAILAYSDMDGEYDQLEEIDDDLLGMLPLDDLQSPCISDEAHEPVVDEDPLISKSSQQGAIIGTQKDKLYEHGNFHLMQW